MVLEKLAHPAHFGAFGGVMVRLARLFAHLAAKIHKDDMLGKSN